MWIVEVNLAGRRFVHEVHARRPFFRFSSRNFGWRQSQLSADPRGLIAPFGGLFCLPP